MNISSVNMDKCIVVLVCLGLCLHRLSMSVGNFLWGAALVLVLYRMVHLRKQGIRLTNWNDFKPFYLGIGVCFISFGATVVAHNFDSIMIKTWLETWLYRAVPLFIFTLLQIKAELIKKILWTYLGALSIDCLTAFYQVATGILERGHGFGGHCLDLASIISVTLPIVLVIIFDKSFDKKIKCGAFLFFFFLLLGLLATKSRAAFFLVFVQGLFLCGIYAFSNRRTVVAFVLICSLVCGGAFLAPGFNERMQTTTNVTTDGSNIERLYMWRSSLLMVKDYPMAGVGLRKFKEEYRDKYIFRGRVPFNHAHSNYFGVLAETGWTGFIGFMFFCLYALYVSALRWWKTKSPYSLMLLAAWISFLSFGAIEFTIGKSAIMKVWWFLVGTLTLLAREQEDEKNEN